MRPIDADALRLMKVEECAGHMLEYAAGWKACIDWIKTLPTVDALPVKHVITVLMDLRDAFVAKQPRSEWVNNKVAQGVEKGIEMCIARIREMAQHD